MDLVSDVCPSDLSARGDACLDDAACFVDGGEQQPAQDLLVGEGPRLHTHLGSRVLDDLRDFRVGMRRAVALLVAVPACTRLLTVAAHLEQPVGDRQLAVVRVGGGAALAAGMADVETSEVAAGRSEEHTSELQSLKRL